LKDRLDALYRRYHRRCFVEPDPLQFLYAYPRPGDRELAGLVASSLAYGRVSQILVSVSAVLDVMGPSPEAFVQGSTRSSLNRAVSGFKHRFSTGEEMALLLWRAREVIKEYGSLETCFLEGLRPDHETVLPALCSFAGILRPKGASRGTLIPLPERGSACKRLNLFLRWMVRSDEVDPGGWEAVSAAKLIIPLDTHMHRICLGLGGTRRRQADMKAALEATTAFRALAPEDPVRYDFSLTRLGIRREAGLDEFLRGCKGFQREA
jgi:uncharacterized protein (TIGR02757 family)